MAAGVVGSEPTSSDRPPARPTAPTPAVATPSRTALARSLFRRVGAVLGELPAAQAGPRTDERTDASLPVVCVAADPPRTLDTERVAVALLSLADALGTLVAPAFVGLDAAAGERARVRPGGYARIHLRTILYCCRSGNDRVREEALRRLVQFVHHTQALPASPSADQLDRALYIIHHLHESIAQLADAAEGGHNGGHNNSNNTGDDGGGSSSSSSSARRDSTGARRRALVHTLRRILSDWQPALDRVLKVLRGKHGRGFHGASSSCLPVPFDDPDTTARETGHPRPAAAGSRHAVGDGGHCIVCRVPRERWLETNGAGGAEAGQRACRGALLRVRAHNRPDGAAPCKPAWAVVMVIAVVVVVVMASGRATW